MKRKVISKFENEDQERSFWSEADSTQYVDWRSARRVVLPQLKPSHRTIAGESHEDGPDD